MEQLASTRVFQIYELAEMIVRCTFHRMSNGSAFRRQTLVALTTVNRLLSLIAISEIWKVVESGLPLRRLLPTYFTELVPPAKANRRMIKELNLPVATPWDLERYMKYCSHIHALNLTTDNPMTCELLATADNYVHQLGLNDSHYPKLSTLCIPLSNFKDPTLYLKMRGKPTMESISVNTEDRTQRSWFQAIGRNNCNLSSLEIRARGTGLQKESFQSEFGLSLNDLVCLKALKLDIIPDAIHFLLSKVSKLPLISSLTLRIPALVSQETSFPQDLDMEVAMQDRKSLHLEYQGQVGEGLHTILSVSRAVFISYWSIKFVTIPVARPRQMQDILGWVRSHHPEVRSLKFCDQMIPYQFVVDHHLRNNNVDLRTELQIPPTVTIQLATLRNLRYLRLSTFAGTGLTSKLLETFGKSLESLETCIFNPFRLLNSQGESGCTVALADAINFAIRCPTLRHLGICCDARERTNGSSETIARVNEKARPQLHTLDLGQSIIDVPAFVMDLLGSSIPTLRRVQFGLESDGIHDSLLMTDLEKAIWAEFRAARRNVTFAGGG